MSPNQGESAGIFRPGQKQSAPWEQTGSHYSIVVVSRNIQIHQALDRTLQHFSINGRGIRILNARDLPEARNEAEKHPDIILVVIDNDVQVNGSYASFVSYVQQELNNRTCCITFKDNIIRNNSCERDESLTRDEHYEKFFNARERLIDITRMVMMTTDMEHKISDQGMAEGREEESSWLTREKLNTVMAHDLREPLGNIKVMLEFLTNEPELLDKETSKDLLNRVKESADNIHDLLEDYLFWSRMFKQEIYFNPGKADIGQIVRENLLLLKSTAAGKGVTLRSAVAENTFVFADEYMITTVVRNLVYNAIKFTQAGGEVALAAKLHPDKVEIRVMDTGVGIPKESLEKLFRADVRLSTAGTDKESGAGLGLMLCKDFVEKNGGRIAIESDEESGSTFTFTLPVWSFAELT